MNELTNTVKLSGQVVEEPVFNHEAFSEKFYKTTIKVFRKSGIADFVPVVISQVLFDANRNWKDAYVNVSGQIRTRNVKTEDGHSKLIINVFVLDWSEINESDCSNDNNVSLVGYICKKPVYRTTPMGREIADVTLAVNRPYGKSDYIPIICWGRCAKLMETMYIGTKIELCGRFQSRDYIKRNEFGDESEFKTAYEVSSIKFGVIRDEGN